MLGSVRQMSAPEAAVGSRRGRFVGPLLAANVFVVGVTLTVLTVGGLHADQRENAGRVMDQRTAVARAAVAGETSRYLTVLHVVAAGIGTDDQVTGRAFTAATAPLDVAGMLGATSVAFVVPAGPDEVAATQARWRDRGATGLVLQPQPGADRHFFSVFSHPLNSAGAPMAGLDAAGSPEGMAALTESRSTGGTTVSDTYVLIRDRGLPAARQQLSFIFAAPVFTPGGDPEFRGWVVLGVHGQDFLGAVLSTASQGQLDGELLTTNADGRQVKVAAYAPRAAGDLRREATVAVANRQWTLVTRADTDFLPGAHSSLPMTVLLGGVALTVLLCWLVWILATGRSRARHQVQVATAELRTAEAESRRQAGLLGAIMASLGDGVGVVDADGAFLLHNPAAKALLGVSDDVDGPQEWQEHYGLFRADGRTPFPVEEMPLVRALNGESSDGVEMLVRNAGRPDGILVSVDGRPLDADAAGQRGAVAVFHDITELRRYETDLSVFAGVVAHDLKAPLAVIRGHCETAADELTDAPENPQVLEARAALTRIAGAVDRMAGLIDTLLAYTTARDAPLKLETVELRPLVDGVLEDRVGHLRPGAGPAPEIYVGPLPRVEADPAMLRHIVDNLIGNALKYVQAGKAARIDVTATAGSDEWTWIDIADRGIGIPDADKPDIFEAFHRAHTAAGYAGTGLGLAICRRIVERHGGVIGVTDNPGGGTCFHFTLPLADPTGHPTDADRAALDRALAGRTAIERTRVPALPARPVDVSATHLRAAAPQAWPR
jgi:signal transduction histidine kinase/CHASE1-domain containing sensor protein